MSQNDMPPFIKQADKVILFDGVCKLCNRWSQFIIKYDKAHHFKLCSVQSSEGKAILKYFNMPTNTFETMLYIEGNQKFEKSDAFLNIIKHMSYPWKLFRAFKIIPKPIRDWLYDRIALNRYRLFGKYEQCVLPTADHQSRFISHD